MLRRIEIITETGDRELEGLKRVTKMLNELTQTRCKHCGSMYVVKNGRRRGTQYWLCKNCGRGFVDNKALPKMKYSIDNIASAVYLYYTGSSLNEIRRHIEQHHNVLPSDSTIYSWVTHFTKIATNKASEYKPEVGDTWIADETVLDISGKKYWLWDIIDSDTRFLLATHLSPTRTTKDAQKLMELAEKKAGKIPKIVITDKLASYLDGIELTFGADTKHIQSKPFIDKDSTNLIERFHGTLKDRTKVMRGFKNLESARLVLDGWLVYYNFLRPHESLKDKTPAQAAKIKFPFKNWLAIIQSQSPKREYAQELSSSRTKSNKPTLISKPYRKRSKPKRKKKQARSLKTHPILAKGIRTYPALTEARKI